MGIYYKSFLYRAQDNYNTWDCNLVYEYTHRKVFFNNDNNTLHVTYNAANPLCRVLKVQYIFFNCLVNICFL